MPETPTFGRCAEIPYDEMMPEQAEGYRLLVNSIHPGTTETEIGDQVLVMRSLRARRLF